MRTNPGTQEYRFDELVVIRGRRADGHGAAILVNAAVTEAAILTAILRRSSVFAVGDAEYVSVVDASLLLLLLLLLWRWCVLSIDVHITGVTVHISVCCRRGFRPIHAVLR